MVKKRKIKKEVAYHNGLVVIEENLPFPIVYYPGHYGTFFAFTKSGDSKIYFCSCAKTAILNYIRLRVDTNEINNSDPQKNYIISKSDFPKRIIYDLTHAEINDVNSVFDSLSFKDDVCHECNKITPTLSYCVPMYGSVFVLNYGWYINKQSYEYGVRPISFNILEDICPDEIFEHLDGGKTAFFKKYNSMSVTDLILAQANNSEFQKETRKIKKVIENEVRVKFGFKNVGEAWATETLLYHLVCQIFPTERVVRHYRPEFLEYLELDVFIPKLKIGIEYQGIQHFKPVDHWGGEKSFKQVVKRDARKKKLCLENDIKLIYFYHNEEISEELVKNKLINNC